MEISFEGIILRPWSIDDAGQSGSGLLIIKKLQIIFAMGFRFHIHLKDAIDWLNSDMPENYPPRFFAITVE